MKFYVEIFYHMSKREYWQRHMLELQEDIMEVMQPLEIYSELVYDG